MTETGGSRAHRLRWWTLAVLCLSSSLVVVANTVVNVALPTIGGELSASAGELQWIVEAYLLTFAGLLLASGALGDRYGRRLSLVAGLVVFGAASALGAFAGSGGELIAARAVMGVGAAMIMPPTLSLLRTVFGPGERATAIGVWGAVASVSAVAGPVLGGWLVSSFSWGAVFLVNAPLAALALAGALLFVPEARHPSSAPLDWVGAGLCVAGLCALVFGVTEAVKLSWTDPLTLAALGGGAFLLLAFVLWERRNPSPLIDLAMFGDPRFSAASFSLALAYAALFGVSFVLPQYLQYVLAYGPLETGLRLAPMTLVLAVTAVLGAWLVNRLGARAVIVGGLAATAAGLAALSAATAGSGYGLLLVAFVLMGAGIGAAATAATDSIMDALPEDKAGASAAVDETAIEFGGAMGIAVLGSTLAAGYTRAFASNAGAEGLPPGAREPAAESIGTAAEIGGVALEVARAAFAESMGSTMLVGVGMVLLGAAVALVFMPRHLKKVSDPETAAGRRREKTKP